MLKFQAEIMEKQESKSDQLGRHLADVIYHMGFVVPLGLTLATIERILEERPLGQKVGLICMTSLSWAAISTIRWMINIQRAEDEINYVDDRDLKQ